VVSFDGVVDDYDAARPSYPDSVYDALPSLRGALVVEGGAGTGIATRALRARGAHVVATDVGEQMLCRNVGDRVVADTARAPLRGGCADLVCFAQSWHWLDHEIASIEMRRLLRDGGTWAGWWSFARADGESWFEAYWDVLEARTGARRAHRDTDISTTLDDTLFTEPARTDHPWTREVSLDLWLTDQRSHSYIGMSDNHHVMPALEAILRGEFGAGPVRCRYETSLWQATTR
jgi:SAM-dependent methyltransferase